MTEQKSNPLLTRRTFLKIGLPAAGGIAALSYFAIPGTKSNRIHTSNAPLVRPGEDRSPQHLARVYASLLNEVETICAAAREQGKKPMFILGEAHTSEEAFIVELMVLGILNTLHVRDKELFIEGGRALAADINTGRALITDGNNIPHLANAAHKRLDYHVTAIDDERLRNQIIGFDNTPHTEAENTRFIDDRMPARDEAMGSIIHQRDAGCGVAVCGAAHVKGIVESLNKKEGGYLIANLNLSHLSAQNKEAMIGNRQAPNFRAGVDYIVNPENAGQMTVNDYDKPRRPFEDVVRAVAAGMKLFGEHARDFGR